jgi:hypothetical protein
LATVWIRKANQLFFATLEELQAHPQKRPLVFIISTEKQRENRKCLTSTLDQTGKLVNVQRRALGTSSETASDDHHLQAQQDRKKAYYKI